MYPVILNLLNDKFDALKIHLDISHHLIVIPNMKIKLIKLPENFYQSYSM